METTTEVLDKFYYYRLLAEMVWGPYNKVLDTTSWRTLDDLATAEQKEKARDRCMKASASLDPAVHEPAPAPRIARKQPLTELQQSVMEHDQDMARLDRNTLPPAPVSATHTAPRIEHCSTCGSYRTDDVCPLCEGPRIEAEATALPWEVHEGEDYTVILGGDLDHTENPIARVTDPRDAYLIVNAVNQRQGLIEALRDLYDAVRSIDGYEDLLGKPELQARAALESTGPQPTRQRQGLIDALHELVTVAQETSQSPTHGRRLADALNIARAALASGQ